MRLYCIVLAAALGTSACAFGPREISFEPSTTRSLVRNKAEVPEYFVAAQATLVPPDTSR